MVRPLSARLAQAVRPRRLPQTHARLHQQRFASSTPSAEEVQKKAQDALAQVQKGLGQAFETGKRFLGPAGEKAASLLGGTSHSRCFSRAQRLSSCRLLLSFLNPLAWFSCVLQIGRGY